MSLNHASRYMLFSFENQAQATKAYDRVKAYEKARLIPLPPEIDKGCGLSLRIREEDFKEIFEIFKEENIEYAQVFKFYHEDFKRKIEKYVFW